MAFTCPDCGRTSHHPEDEANGYCGACHWWTGHPLLSPLRAQKDRFKEASEERVRLEIRYALWTKDEKGLETIAALIGMTPFAASYERTDRYRGVGHHASRQA